MSCHVRRTQRRGNGPTRVQPHLTPTPDPVSFSQGSPYHVEGTCRGPKAPTSDDSSEGRQQHRPAPQRPVNYRCNARSAQDHPCTRILPRTPQRPRLGPPPVRTSADRKVLKSWSDLHQVISGAGAAPPLADVATLTAPDGVSLNSNIATVTYPTTIL